MTELPGSRSPTTPWRFPWDEHDWLTGSALVSLLAGVITLLADRLYPVWTDDGWFATLSAQGGDLHQQVLDRPLIGWFWQFWHTHGGYLGVAMLVHWLGWAGLALSAMWVWRQLFPDQRQFGFAVACFVLAPVVCEAQWVLVNFPICAALGSALATIALGLLLINAGSSCTANLRLALAAALVFVGGQLSEYSAPTAVVAAVVLFLRPWFARAAGGTWRRGIFSVGILLVAAALSYALYHALGNALARQRVRPELLLSSSLSWRLKTVVPRLVSQFWLAIAGAAGNFAGKIRFDTVATLVAAAVGSLTALLVTMRVVPARAAGALDRPGAEPHASSAELNWWPVAALCTALLCGLLPIVVMGAESEGRASSRYLLPVLPIASCAMIAILLRFVRRRCWWLIPALAGFAVGYGQTSEFIWARQDESRLLKWSAEVRQHLASDGLTVAVFDSQWAHSDLVSGPFELTYWLTAGPGWTEAERQRFWAFGSLESTQTSKGTVTLFSDHPHIDLEIRGVGRHGPIARILWLRSADDSLVVESLPAPSAPQASGRPQ